MGTDDQIGAAPPDRSVAGYEAALAAIAARQGELRRDLEAAPAEFARFAAAKRAARRQRHPADRMTLSEQQALRQATAADEATIEVERGRFDAHVEALRHESSALDRRRAELARERDALIRLDAWDALTAATRAANAALAADPADGALVAEAVRARREVWLRWRLVIGGTAEAPELIVPPGVTLAGASL